VLPEGRRPAAGKQALAHQDVVGVVGGESPSRPSEPVTSQTQPEAKWPLALFVEGGLEGLERSERLADGAGQIARWRGALRVMHCQKKAWFQAWAALLNSWLLPAFFASRTTSSRGRPSSPASAASLLVFST